MSTVLLKIDESPVLLVARYGSKPPRNRVIIGDVTHEGVDKVGWTAGPHLLADLVEVDKSPPGEFFHHVSETADLAGTTYTITHAWEAWTQTEIDAEIERRRDVRVAREMDDFEAVVRATVLVIMDEFNRHSAVHTAIIQAAADNGNYAGFRSALGAITSIPARTTQQLRDAIRAKLGS